MAEGAGHDGDRQRGVRDQRQLRPGSSSMVMSFDMVCELTPFGHVTTPANGSRMIRFAQGCGAEAPRVPLDVEDVLIARPRGGALFECVTKPPHCRSRSCPVQLWSGPTGSPRPARGAVEHSGTRVNGVTGVPVKCCVGTPSLRVAEQSPERSSPRLQGSPHPFGVIRRRVPRPKAPAPLRCHA
jgi:hypothetical protein